MVYFLWFRVQGLGYRAWGLVSGLVCGFSDVLLVLGLGVLGSKGSRLLAADLALVSIVI